MRQVRVSACVVLLMALVGPVHGADAPATASTPAATDSPAARPVPAGAARPNIVFILADDLGYGDLGCYGHPYARTPQIDKLAAEGTRFTQFYVTGITCCPSRTGFMTGKFPASFAKYPAGHGFGSRATVSELLHRAGYVAGHFGKWHIGPDESPGVYGFDEVQGDRSAESGKAKRIAAERGRDAAIFDAATAFIERHRGKPFFVQIWGHTSHFPVDPPPAYAARFRDVTVREADFGPAMRAKFAQVRKLGGDVDAAMRNYLGDVAALDDCVGRLLARLDDLGLSERTLVVFSSDHGPAPVEGGKDLDSAAGGGKTRRDFAVNMLGSPGPFQGGKHTQHEGGLRVPFIVCWPGRVPAGRVDEASVLSAADWLPTLCRLVGAAPPADLDGEDALDAWLGQRPHVRIKPLLWKTNSSNSDIAIRVGPWKLHVPHRKRGELELFHVLDDPAELTNRAAERPEVVAELRARVEAWGATLPREYDKSGARDD